MSDAERTHHIHQTWRLDAVVRPRFCPFLLLDSLLMSRSTTQRLKREVKDQPCDWNQALKCMSVTHLIET